VPNSVDLKSFGMVNVWAHSRSILFPIYYRHQSAALVVIFSFQVRMNLPKVFDLARWLRVKLTNEAVEKGIDEEELLAS